MEITASLMVKPAQEQYSVELKLHANNGVQVSYLYLSFSIAQPFDPASLEGGILESRQGDLHRIRLAADYDGQQDVSVTFKGDGSIKKATDYPDGLFLEAESEVIGVILPRPIERIHYEATAITDQTPKFIPMCDTTLGEGLIHWGGAFSFEGALWNQPWLERLMERMSGNAEPSAGSTTHKLVAIQDNSLISSFELTISESEFCLRYGNEAAFLNGQAYVYQYLLQLALGQELKTCELRGEPRFGYRGVHLDVVRHFFEAGAILGWLDILALFHFNQFHWHLTDDDGWRLQSEAFPELTDVGAWRGLQEALPPQMGSGHTRYGGFYTAEQARDVVARGESLGINVVPEMDLPGHARALLKSLPTLIEADDQSEYRSVQHFGDNVLNPVFGETMGTLTTLVDEWLAIFPSELFHVGSDEIPKNVWQGSPSAQKWQIETGEPIRNLQGLLLSLVESQLTRAGRTMAGWEEVVEGDGASTNTWVYSWQGTEAGIAAAKAGHSVVMTPAQSCYLDLSVTDKFEDPGYWWAGTVDFKKVYQYEPFKGFPVENTAKIEGVQYCLWSELVESPADAEYMWFPRLLAGAQVVWGGNTNDAFPAFNCSAQRWMNVLSHLGLRVRSEKSSW